MKLFKPILDAKKVYFYRKFLPYKLFLRHPFHLFNHFRNKAFPIPWFIDFDITTRCNLNCSFCYFKNSMNKSRDLTTDEVVNFLNTLKKGTFLVLSGGEPFIRKDIFQIIRRAKENKLKVGLFTNGLLLNSGKCEEIVNSGLDQILFSIHGLPHYHDNLTGVKGATDKIMENIALLKSKSKKNKPDIYISCTVTEENVEDIDKLSSLAESLNIDGFKIEHLNFSPRECMEKHEDESRRFFGDGNGPELHTYEREYFGSEFSGKIDRLNRFIYKKNFFKSLFLKPVIEGSEITEWYCGDEENLCKKKCPYILNSLYIFPDGSVHPCQFYRYSLGNIKDTHIYDIWNSQKLKLFREALKDKLLPGCYRCCKL